MPFIPHTEDDIKIMLEAIGAPTIHALFDEIPKELVCGELTELPIGLNEMAVTRLMQERSPVSRPGSCFIGAGAYEHHIPAAVWQIAARGEFYTAYTPYQAEASQGSLQLMYEYQSMMAELMRMDVSNASLYDGSSALAEACLMAVRIKKSKLKKILIPETVHPVYRQVLTTVLNQREIELVAISMDVATGTIDFDKLQHQDVSAAAALVIPQPNFFGCLEATDALTNWAHQNNLLVIGRVNPIAMALLKPPGQWGENGADIVCGEGQPLGIPLSYGGPYFGFMCCKNEYVRQLPGRLVGRTLDKDGKEGYTLTLQAREQHIRRAKATSNICTNQGLMVVAATIYLCLLGGQGLREVAIKSHANAITLRKKLCALPGVKQVYSAPIWHEFVIELPCDAAQVFEAMSNQGIHAGYVLAGHKNRLLICATETKTNDDLDRYVEQMRKVLEAV